MEGNECRPRGQPPGRGSQQVSYLLVSIKLAVSQVRKFANDQQSTGLEVCLNQELLLSSENAGVAIRQFETDVLQSGSFWK